jgi:hypothetical protein
MNIDGTDAPNYIGAWTLPVAGIDCRLDMWLADAMDTAHHGKARIAYTFHAGDELIFSGDDFRPGLSTAPDSDAAAGALIGFLSLKPGDTDPDYFADYSERQMDFAREHGEDLAVWADDLENAPDPLPEEMPN